MPPSLLPSPSACVCASLGCAPDHAQKWKWCSQLKSIQTQTSQDVAPGAAPPAAGLYNRPLPARPLLTYSQPPRSRHHLHLRKSVAQHSWLHRRLRRVVPCPAQAAEPHWLSLCCWRWPGKPMAGWGAGARPGRGAGRAPPPPPCRRRADWGDTPGGKPAAWRNMQIWPVNAHLMLEVYYLSTFNSCTFPPPAVQHLPRRPGAAGRAAPERVRL